MRNNLVFIIVSIDHLFRKPQFSWDLGYFSVILGVSALARPGAQGCAEGHGLQLPPRSPPRIHGRARFYHRLCFVHANLSKSESGKGFGLDYDKYFIKNRF